MVQDYNTDIFLIVDDFISYLSSQIDGQNDALGIGARHRSLCAGRRSATLPNEIAVRSRIQSHTY